MTPRPTAVELLLLLLLLLPEALWLLPEGFAEGPPPLFAYKTGESEIFNTFDFCINIYGLILWNTNVSSYMKF